MTTSSSVCFYVVICVYVQKICTNPTRLQVFFMLKIIPYTRCFYKKCVCLCCFYNYYLLSYCLHFWLKCMIKMQKNIVECISKCVCVRNNFNLCKLLCVVASYYVDECMFKVGRHQQGRNKKQKTCKSELIPGTFWNVMHMQSWTQTYTLLHIKDDKLNMKRKIFHGILSQKVIKSV